MFVVIIEIGIGLGFIDTYKAYCAFFDIPRSKSFILFAKSTILSGSRELKLDECPSISGSEVI
jgi:hypothetical protein